MAKIIVQNTEITVLSHDDKDYISPTDRLMASKVKAVLPMPRGLLRDGSGKVKVNHGYNTPKIYNSLCHS